MFEISITTIPHVLQRYNTVGDWKYDPVRCKLDIKVSQFHNWKYEALIGIHELVEVVLCQAMGVSEEQVDTWDLSHLDDDDPGSLEGCPYKLQHTVASILERTLAGFLLVDWDDYESEINKVSLIYNQNKPKINEKKEGQASA